jgi:hypothetical protein
MQVIERSRGRTDRRLAVWIVAPLSGLSIALALCACGPQSPSGVLGFIEELPPGDGSGPGSGGTGNPPSGGGEGGGSDDDAIDSQGPVLSVIPTTLTFGSAVAEMSFVVHNAGSGILQYSIVSSVPWAKPAATAGTSTGEFDTIPVSVNRGGLSDGLYAGSMVVTGAGQVRVITLMMTVASSKNPDSVDEVTPVDPTPAGLIIDPQFLNFGTDLSTLPFSIKNSGTTPMFYVITADKGWVTPLPASGSSIGEVDVINVVVDRSKLSAGVQQATLTVSTGQGLTGYVVVQATGTTGAPTPIAAITGRVWRKDQLGSVVGVPNVAVAADNGGGAAVTDAAGYYTLNVPVGWSGSVWPAPADLGYTPRNRPYPPVTSGVSGQDFFGTAILESAPVLSVKWVDDTWGIYTGAYGFSEPRMTATLAHMGNYRWEVTVNNKSMQAKEVWFPWEQNKYALNPDLNDDVLFSSLYAGVALKPTSFVEWGWQGWIYPGISFAPLSIIADGSRARLVAATNWPPQIMYPMYSLQRQILYYKTPLPPNTSRKYSALVLEVEGNAAVGLHPWQIAVDRYSGWLREAMAADGLEPVAHSSWMHNANGFIQMSVMNDAWFDPAQLLAKWNKFKDRFPWVLVWGQMSNYHGDPALAVPPLLPGEKTGCCLDIREEHIRYVPGLTVVANTIKSQGGAIGYYCRPRGEEPNYGMLDDPNLYDGETNMQFFLNWIAKNRDEYAANTFYTDVLGRANFGDPVPIINAFKSGAIAADTLIEGVIDCYPSAGLWDGFLSGQPFGGGPNQPLEKLGQGFISTSVPRFGRYLLGNRIACTGQSNTDGPLWGPAANHFVERQSFLLGAKFNTYNPEQPVGGIDGLNPAVYLAIEEWKKVNFWARRPVYRDRLGIYNLPVGIDARHFVDKNGVSLLAIDNWDQLPNKSFTFKGNTVLVPTSRLSIIEWGGP